jgi:VWFA-related protein
VRTGAALIAFALGSTLAAQQAASPPQPPFRTGTQAVEVDVRVFDKDGRFVSDLTRDDFDVREDDAAQSIDTLTLVGTPPIGALAPSAASTSSTSSPPSAPSSRRVWLFVFDTPHLSPAGVQRSRAAASDFIKEKLTGGDLAGVVADGKMANNRLTSDRAELAKVVDAVKMPGDMRSLELEMRDWPRLQDEFEAWRIAVQNDADALRQAVTRACTEDPDMCKAAPPDAMVREKAQRIMSAAMQMTRATLSVVEGLSNGLARMPGPKTVVFFSDGFVMQEMESALRHAVGQANRAGARFYTIDTRGLNRGSASSPIIDQARAFDPAGASTRFDTHADGTTSLAVDTGGIAIRNENNFGRALDLIERDASTYYVLGYTPSNQSFDGKYRQIAVSVKGRPGVKVRARRGYLAVQPALLLTPKPTDSTNRGAGVSTPSADATAPIAAAGQPSQPSISVPEPAAAHDTTPAEAAPAAVNPSSTLRSRIDRGGFVQQLQTQTAAAPDGDAASAGWAAYQRGDVAGAAAQLSRAAAAPGAHAWVSYALGLSQLALEKYADAAQAWERVRRDVPEFEPVYFNLADAYLLQHNEVAALKVLRDAQGRFPKDDEVWNATGVIHVRRGALDAAIEAFERATAAAPAEGLGYFNLARAYQMRYAKSQHFDRNTGQWFGAEGDRRRAQQNYEKYLGIGGPFASQAREALAALSWRS